LSAGKIASLMFETQGRFGQVRNLRKMAQLGLPAATQAAAKEQSRALLQVANLPELSPYLSPEQVAKLGEKAVATQASDFQAAVDSASLIFAHSITDALTFELCEIAANVSPLEWEPFVGSKNISLAEAKGREYRQLLESTVAGHLCRQVANFSLPKKVRRLLSLCKPEPGILSYEGYKFSEERLSKIDQQRHDVTHKEGPRSLDNIEDDIDFLERTAFVLIAAVMKRYDLWPNGDEMEGRSEP
jgi:hypothetical protein